MKKSDKLLLITIASVVGIMLVSFLDLHHRYSTGQYLVHNGLEDEAKKKKRVFPTPHYLQIEGVADCILMPSDTFYLEYPAEENILFSGGDSLLVRGSDTIRDPSGRQIEGAPVNSLIIHSRSIPNIELAFCARLLLQGETYRDRIMPYSTSILMRNGTVVVGPVSDDRAEKKISYFDSLSIHCINSELEVGGWSDIGDLRITMGAASTLTNLDGKIGKLSLTCQDSSAITISGANLKKLMH